jgi:hypothetical protein
MAVEKAREIRRLNAEGGIKRGIQGEEACEWAAKAITNFQLRIVSPATHDQAFSRRLGPIVVSSDELVKAVEPLPGWAC